MSPAGRSGSGGAGRSGGGRAGGNSSGRAGGGRAGGSRAGGGRAGGAGGAGRSGEGRPGTGRSGTGRSGVSSGSGRGNSTASSRSGGGFGGYDNLGPRGEPRSLAKGLDGMQVEGRIAVREVLAVGRRRVKAVLMAEGTDDSPILKEIEDLARDTGVPIRWMSREMVLAQARTEAPQGVIAHCAELEDVDPDDLLERNPHGEPQPFLLALDGLTDPRNLGALLRSAQGAGVTGVIIPKHRTVHITPAVTKAAAGAIEHLPIALVSGMPSFLLRAKDRGAWVIGLDAGGDSTVYGLAHLADQPLIVVVGSEGDGLARLTRDRCDVLASIPLRNGLESLNASVAGAIALFELGRHRPEYGPDPSDSLRSPLDRA
jgi:23S rRNA (guanosine2251-2'-O)-methyltransferase